MSEPCPSIEKSRSKRETLHNIVLVSVSSGSLCADISFLLVSVFFKLSLEIVMKGIDSTELKF